MSVTTAGQGSFWVQPKGPNTPVYDIGCLTLNEISQEFGDIVIEHCASDTVPGEYVEVSRTQNPRGEMTSDFEILRNASPSRIWEAVNAGSAFYFLQKIGGPKNIFTDYTVGTRLEQSFFTSRGLSQVAMRNENGTTMESGGLSGSSNSLMAFYPLTLARQTTTETEDILSISSPQILSRGGGGEPVREIDDILFAAGKAASGVEANVLYSTNKGSTWAAMSADPFAADEHVASVQSKKVSSSQILVVAARGVTDASNPAEAAWGLVNITSPGTIVWNTVNIASTNAEFVTGHSGLFMLSPTAIWACTDGGDIVYSSNQGVTWEDQGSPVTSTLNAVYFINDRVGLAGGDSNVIILTKDGGINWNALTGPSSQSGDNILSVALLDEHRLWSSYDDGTLWYSSDGGVNWAERILPKPTGVSALDRINHIVFLDQYTVACVGMYTVSSAEYGVLYRSMNGGFSWERYAYETTFTGGSPTGFNALVLHTNGLLHIAGDEITDTGSLFSATQPAAI